MAVTDLAGDGSNVVVLANESADYVTVDFDGQRSVLADARSGLEAPVAVHLADVNGDGIPDLIVCDQAADRVLIFSGGARRRPV